MVRGCGLAFNDAMERAKAMAHITMPAAAIIVQIVMANLDLLELRPVPWGPCLEFGVPSTKLEAAGLPRPR